MMTDSQKTHSIDQAELWQVVAIPAPVEGAVKVLVWVRSPVDWVQIVGKLSKVMNPAVSLHSNSAQRPVTISLKAR